MKVYSRFVRLCDFYESIGDLFGGLVDRRSHLVRVTIRHAVSNVPRMRGRGGYALDFRQLFVERFDFFFGDALREKG